MRRKRRPQPSQRYNLLSSLLAQDVAHADEGYKGYKALRRSQLPGVSLAVDKSEGVVKDKNVLSGVCDTACSPEKVEDQDPGISR